MLFLMFYFEICSSILRKIVYVKFLLNYLQKICPPLEINILFPAINHQTISQLKFPIKFIKPEEYAEKISTAPSKQLRVY